jgi:hypothetical protein
LLKASGIWGSGLDTLLTLLRDTLKVHGGKVFPVDELEATMARRGKALTFEEEELQELVELRYGEPRTFALLSLIFPFISFHNQFHVDHIFPRAQFAKSRLRKADLTEEQVEQFQNLRDGLANLQLLDGTANIEKQQQSPHDWLVAMYPDITSRADYCEKHLLGDVPKEISEFEAFYETRKVKLGDRIKTLLKRSGTA